MMERAAGTLNGSSFFDKNNNGVEDAGEAILQRQNIGEAEIHGIEIDGVYRLFPFITIFGNFTYTKGTDTVNDNPLSRIPPKFGTIGVRWVDQSRWKPWIETIFHFASEQRDINPVDVKDTRIGPNGTDGFNIFHIRTGASISTWLHFKLALENVFNKKYKYHSSGIYRPGRQFILGAEIIL
jgi:outer membrane receptor protein involved in Fe transport